LANELYTKINVSNEEGFLGKFFYLEHILGKNKLVKD